MEDPEVRRKVHEALATLTELLPLLPEYGAGHYTRQTEARETLDLIYRLDGTIFYYLGDD